MTISLNGSQIAEILGERFDGSITSINTDSLLIKSEGLPEIASFLKNTAGLDFNFLSSVIGTDYKDYFEIVYRIESIKNNRNLILRVRCPREKATVPSVTGIWQGADLQEREIYDLLGVNFNGHPNMKRIVLWDGFNGHPLRKDFINGA